LRPLHPEFTADTLQAAAGTAKDPKLSSHLSGLIRADEQARLRGSAITAGSTGMLPEDLRAAVDSRLMRLDDQGNVQVYIQPSGAIEELPRLVLGVGGVVELSDGAAGLVQAQVPIRGLRALSEDPSVRLVRLPDYGFKQAGSTTTQGDSILRANLARSSFGVDGTGVRVGVISDGVGGIGNSQASGDLGGIDLPRVVAHDA